MYTGWYFGAGQIDRICAHGIYLLTKDDFDGTIAVNGYFTPYLTTTQCEIVLYNANTKIKREVNNEHDSEFLINNNK